MSIIQTKENQHQRTSGILVFLERAQGEWTPLSLELIGAAQTLAAMHDEPVYGAFVGNESPEDLPAIAAGLPINALYAVLDPALSVFFANAHARALVHCIDQCHPTIVLIGATPTGKSIAPMAATHFSTGLTADCTDLQLDEERNLVQIRPAFGGNILAKIITPNTRPQFATVRSGVMPSIALRRGHQPTLFIDSLPREGDSLLSRVHCAGQKHLPVQKKIGDANTLVVVGRGIQKKEDLLLAQNLADCLHGELASSRALVEKGWMPPDRQIGLSGQAVAPAYMVTLGVSGSVQFMAGASGAKNLIAVNCDPEAAIMQSAHLPICADLYEALPHLLDQLCPSHP